MIEVRKSDSTSDDFISKLINGSNLTKDRLISAVELICHGSYQTSVHFLSVVAMYLMRDPALLNQLISLPELVTAFVDEMLRLFSPVKKALRHATQRTTLRGKTINKGDAVWFSLAAANRDPEHFINPDKIDLFRKSDSPSLVFGCGPHICLGIYLEATQACIAVRHLLPLLAKMSCPDDDDLDWIQSFLFRGVKALPIINKI